MLGPLIDSLIRVIRSDDTWLELSGAPLPVEDVRRWAIRPDCGAVVVFCGTTRDHAGDRVGVTELHYEAYDCLLYTSDAADDLLCVDLGCRRIIQKKT